MSNFRKFINAAGKLSIALALVTLAGYFLLGYADGGILIAVGV